MGFWICKQCNGEGRTLTIMQSMPCNAAIVQKMKEIEPYLFLCPEILFQINPQMAPNTIKSFWRLGSPFTCNGGCSHPKEKLQRIKKQMDILMTLQALKEQKEKVEEAEVDASISKLDALASACCPPWTTKALSGGIHVGRIYIYVYIYIYTYTHIYNIYIYQNMLC